MLQNFLRKWLLVNWTYIWSTIFCYTISRKPIDMIVKAILCLATYAAKYSFSWFEESIWFFGPLYFARMSPETGSHRCWAYTVKQNDRYSDWEYWEVYPSGSALAWSPFVSSICQWDAFISAVWLLTLVCRQYMHAWSLLVVYLMVWLRVLILLACGVESYSL